MQDKGILYLVGTPIGNLDDITFRAVKTLKEVDLIAAEDTRHTRKLLTHFAIHVPLISYHEYNKKERGPELIKKLLSGTNIAQVSDAGLPGIADPGSDLVRLALTEKIQVIPVSGVNAALTALIASGLDTVRFSFIGFLPKKAIKRKAVLEEVKLREDTLIFYETPHRLKSILQELIFSLGEMRKITVCRELTKKFEQFIRGTLAEVSKYFDQNEPRGEFVLIVEGNKNDENTTTVTETLEEYLRKLLTGGVTTKEASKEAANHFHLSRRQTYQLALKIQRQ